MTPEQFALFAQIEEHHWWFVARRRIMRAVLSRMMPPARDHVVVDIGCGTGGNIASLRADYSCIGIDSSADAIHYARERFSDVDFVEVGLNDDLGPYVSRASAVLCMDVIEHVEEDVDFVARLVQSLTPGSQLLLTVPADMSLWSEHDETNHHFRRYSLSEFERVWSGLPVRARLLTYFNTRLYPVVKVLLAVGRMRGRARGDAGTHFSMPSPLVNRLLERVFHGEVHALLDMLDSHRPAFARGMSLIAVLERIDA